VEEKCKNRVFFDTQVEISFQRLIRNN
jgi:hypothetical protein